MRSGCCGCRRTCSSGSAWRPSLYMLRAVPFWRWLALGTAAGLVAAWVVLLLGCSAEECRRSRGSPAEQGQRWPRTPSRTSSQDGMTGLPFLVRRPPGAVSSRSAGWSAGCATPGVEAGSAAGTPGGWCRGAVLARRSAGRPVDPRPQPGRVRVSRRAPPGPRDESDAAARSSSVARSCRAPVPGRRRCGRCRSPGRRCAAGARQALDEVAGVLVERGDRAAVRPGLERPVRAVVRAAGPPGQRHDPLAVLALPRVPLGRRCTPGRAGRRCARRRRRASGRPGRRRAPGGPAGPPPRCASAPAAPGRRSARSSAAGHPAAAATCSTDAPARMRAWISRGRNWLSNSIAICPSRVRSPRAAARNCSSAGNGVALAAGSDPRGRPSRPR